MESKNLKNIEKQEVIKDIEKWITKTAYDKVKEMRFDIKANICYLKYNLLKNFERILKNRTLTNEEIQKIKTYGKM